MVGANDDHEGRWHKEGFLQFGSGFLTVQPFLVWYVYMTMTLRPAKRTYGRPPALGWFIRIIYVIRPNRLVAAFLRNRAVVRGSISAAIVLSLILFGAISFLWMVGPEVVSHDWLRIGKGSFSDSPISADGSHAGP